MKEALFYRRENGNIRCYLCPHNCLIKEGKRGVCNVRENIEGRLISLSYGKIIAAHVDPVEKKPLFHFMPGTRTFSIATPGCNFQCPYCQNWSISQIVEEMLERAEDVLPEDIVMYAERTNSASISYTYTEPTIFFEFAMDTGLLAVKKGIKNVFVTNGFITEDALKEAKKFLHAANVDLKSFRESFYKRFCKGKLQPVLDALKWMKSNNIWVEVTTLVIPEENDSEDELREIARFIRDELGRETPWHITRFHPDYRMLDKPTTPSHKLERGREIGLEEGLKYVYTGNLPGHPGENTYCPSCKRVVIKRYGFSVEALNLKNGRCTFCGEEIEGIWLNP